MEEIMTDERKEKLRKKYGFLLTRGERVGVLATLSIITACAIVSCIGAWVGLSWLAITGLVATAVSYIGAGITKFGEVFVNRMIDKIQKELEFEEALDQSKDLENSRLIQQMSDGKTISNGNGKSKANSKESAKSRKIQKIQEEIDLSDSLNP